MTNQYTKAAKTKIQRAINSYESWVAKNTDVISDLEVTAKWTSYFISGRISDSNISSELIYALSNMLTLYNDRIINRARGALNDELETTPKLRFCNRLKVILTTLEYSEVLIEISARRALGKTGKWLVVTLIQIFKASARLFLIKYSTIQILTTPTIPSLNRRALMKEKKANGGILPTVKTNGISDNFSDHSISFKLKRSGRLIRKVEGAPPIQYRDFKLFADIAETEKTLIPKELLRAEYLYVAKPLVHLAAVGLFGEKSWKQYVAALLMELGSIQLYYRRRHLMSKQQKLELSRRCLNLLYFLMRSPFYESFTKSRIEHILDFTVQNIPIVRTVSAPLREFIPYWQNIYFYLWST